MTENETTPRPKLKPGPKARPRRPPVKPIIEPPIPPTELSIPIADSGLGEETATIRIDSGQLTQRHVLEVVRALKKSESPVTVVFTGRYPPPKFVTLQEAAEVLSVPLDQVRRYARAGWIKPVAWLEEVGSGRKRRSPTIEIAKETGDWSGWHLRIPWSDIERLTEVAYQLGHLPSLRQPGPNGFADYTYWPNGEVRDISVSAIAQRMLREAIDDDGNQLWLTQAEIRRRTRAEVQMLRPGYKVRDETIATAIVQYGTKKMKVIQRGDPGVLRRRGERMPDDARPKIPVYRWIGPKEHDDGQLEEDYAQAYQTDIDPPVYEPEPTSWDAADEQWPTNERLETNAELAKALTEVQS